MCEDCDYEDLISTIDDLLDDDRYEFASDTLSGIHDTVEEKEHCTDNQRQAVENIQNSVRD
jgi:hypothetical protein